MVWCGMEGLPADDFIILYKSREDTRMYVYACMMMHVRMYVSVCVFIYTHSHKCTYHITLVKHVDADAYLHVIPNPNMAYGSLLIFIHLLLPDTSIIWHICIRASKKKDSWSPGNNKTKALSCFGNARSWCVSEMKIFLHFFCLLYFYPLIQVLLQNETLLEIGTEKTCLQV
jgi:hypothetical protein